MEAAQEALKYLCPEVVNRFCLQIVLMARISHMVQPAAKEDREEEKFQYSATYVCVSVVLVVG